MNFNSFKRFKLYKLDKMELKLNNIKIFVLFPNICRLNKTLLKQNVNERRNHKGNYNAFQSE